MPSIRPCLWLEHNLSEAVRFYTGLFPEAAVGLQQDIPEAPGPEEGAAMAVVTLCGQEIMFLQGGELPDGQSKLTVAISLFLEVDGQAEVDHYWDALLAGGGEPGNCGWLKDRFGLSWQVVPKQFGELTAGAADAQSASRVVQAMLKMNKFDVAALEAAAAG